MRLYFVILLILCHQVGAATINIACDFLSISNALYVTASSGDTINIAAGSCTITNQLSVSGKALIIKGAGTNQTKLISGSGLSTVFLFSAAPGLFTFSDMDLDGHSANNTGFLVTSGGGGPYRFYNLQMTNNFVRGISPGAGDSFGLIDHCIFKNAAGAGSYNNISPQGNGYLSWTTSNPLGTTNACYIEDCYFKDDYTNGGNGFLDSYDGAQVVMRHNVFDGGSYNGTHGYDSQSWSSRTSEIYNNVFTNQNINANAYLIRGGVLMFYSNTIYTAGSMANNPIGGQLLYYRSTTNDGFGSGTYQGTYGYAGLMVNYTNTPTDHAYRYSANWVDGDFVNVAGNDIGYYYFKSSLAAQPGMRVLLGANLGESLTNLMYAINMDTGTLGTKYTSGTVTNNSFRVLHITNANELVMTNMMDGTNAFGWPAAMQPGVLFQTRATAVNSNSQIFPCYNWSNVCFSAGVWNKMDFSVRWSGLGNTDNLMIQGRDYFNDVIPSSGTYQPLVYPHPLQGASGGGGGGSATYYSPSPRMRRGFP